ncbi:MAG: hypothetical protein LBE47_03025 [Methanomassiliicoccaceae archaeon]|nr:hypothetical protein [Methanomassiliicoccaceae archaeon]
MIVIRSVTIAGYPVQGSEFCIEKKRTEPDVTMWTKRSLNGTKHGRGNSSCLIFSILLTCISEI